MTKCTIKPVMSVIHESGVGKQLDSVLDGILRLLPIGGKASITR